MMDKVQKNNFTHYTFKLRIENHFETLSMKGIYCMTFGEEVLMKSVALWELKTIPQKVRTHNFKLGDWLSQLWDGTKLPRVYSDVSDLE
jgi:hypothetical protein